MSSISLENHNRAQLAAAITDDRWVVACLCAAWCDVCVAYQAHFDSWALRHPDKLFIWIDIEDQAEVVGDIDVENFPTLLMQHGDVVAFMGTVLPDTNLADRLLAAQLEKSSAELQAEAVSSDTRRNWQQECNLRQRLRSAAQI